NREITGPRDPNPELASHSQKLIEQIGNLRGRPLFYPYVGTGAGNGPYVELEDGSVKIDLVNGIGINILGHSHPKLIEASVRGSLEDVVVQGNLQPNNQYREITDKLITLASKGTRLKHAWLSTCGTMANENALKMCRQKHSPARKIIAMKDAFAGRSTMMAEVTDNPDYKQGLPDYNEVLRVDFYDQKNPKSIEHSLSQLKKHIEENKGDIACFTFEPMQGEGGYRVAPREFFVPLLELCKANNILVWADEVQTFCRTGELLAIQTLNIGEYVDVVTVAKALKVGATIYTEEYNPKPGLIAGTFSGTSAALSAGTAVLRELSENKYFGPTGKIAEVHNYFVDGLNMLAETTCKGLISEVEGLGLMVAMTPLEGTKDNMMNTLKALFKNGLLTFGCGHGPYRIRFLIPAIMNQKDIQVALKIIEKSLVELKG
ncbi:MAG: aminotransferase class III-fold pyridoxal phosphate-dependent enzyme, partial [Bdellovibrionales bacterium]|nr:aminotransferase class III-fold pyridoxal phosphate-dependent enzyme [Bdellovibrionales bacterium]